MDYDTKQRIPECKYTISFDKSRKLNISGVFEEKTSYTIGVNKEIGLKQDIEKEDNVTVTTLSSEGFNHTGFLERGGKSDCSTKLIYELPSIFKEEKELNIASINKFFDLILTYKYESIEY